jgi:hypothetical protein
MMERRGQVPRARSRPAPSGRVVRVAARQVAHGDWKLGGVPFFLSPLYLYFLGAMLAVSDTTCTV